LARQLELAYICSTLDDNEEKITVLNTRSKLHIEENESQLRIYVLSNKKDHALCYLGILPERLFSEIIMKDQASNFATTINQRAVRVVAGILNGPLDIIDELLERDGINQIQMLNGVNNSRGKSSLPGSSFTSRRSRSKSTPPRNSQESAGGKR
jgi:hypothetical protein